MYPVLLLLLLLPFLLILLYLGAVTGVLVPSILEAVRRETVADFEDAPFLSLILPLLLLVFASAACVYMNVYVCVWRGV